VMLAPSVVPAHAARDVPPWVLAWLILPVAVLCMCAWVLAHGRVATWRQYRFGCWPTGCITCHMRRSPRRARRRQWRHAGYGVDGLTWRLNRFNYPV
jgi:hypothetical protein